jgi:pilus assembly protein CpaF
MSVIDPTLEVLASRIRRNLSVNGDSDIDAAVQRVINEHAESSLASFHDGSPGESELGYRLHAALRGLGPLQPALDDPEVEEIWINAPDRVFVARSGRNERLDLVLDESAVRDLVERMLRPTGRRVDVSQPFVDASLTDGSRVHVVIPDITRRHWSVNIRKFSPQIKSLEDLVSRQVLDPDTASLLSASVKTGHSVLISGATQAGKTTMLRALLSEIPRDQRIVSVEETFELDLDADDYVALQCRGPNLEGTGEVTLRRLVKEALRMRPDRIVVGEVREAEALDLLIALNSGLPGACTIHAKSAHHALVKLCTLPLLAGNNIDRGFVTPTVAGVIDLVVHLGRRSDGSRQLREIVAPRGVSPDCEILSETVFSASAKSVEGRGEGQ